MDPSILIQGAMSVFSDPLTLGFIILGVFVGIIFGAVPGLTATLALIMFLPVTYTMTPVQGLSTLIALYVGGISGGLVAAILLNIPGTPSSIATTFDGAPMAAKGQAGKALGVGVVFSFVGTIFGLIMLVTISPLLASVAIKFGAFEYCAVAVCALALVISLAGRDLVKGLMGAFFGLMVATVGLSPVDSMKRFTFGMSELTSGFALLTILIGLFAITEVAKAAEEVRQKQDMRVETNVHIKGFGFTLKEFFGQKFNALRSSIIGCIIGILPGIGGAISGMLSYTAAKNQSKYPEKFGTGIMDGIVASETANNAGIGGALIPLLTLGIPGDAVTAILLGGLMVHNIAPGPLIFEKSGVVIYGLFVALFLSAIAMLFIELFGIRVFIRVLTVPKYFLLPIIMVLCAIGAFGNSNRIFDVYSIMGFGLVGYGMIKAKIPTVPVIMGIILGPIFEMNFRRVAQLQGSGETLLSHPIAAVLTAVAVAALIFSFIMNRREAKKLAAQEAQNGAAK
ncbi:MAG: tripartite tricarboxylate transporter permease [Selenomonadaceae bacterium]|nr:tripartite tricarboxylate transporter permease [Selenomonadaceae bacterium]